MFDHVWVTPMENNDIYDYDVISLCVFPCLQLFHLQMMFANPARIFAPQPQLSFVSFKVFAPRMVDGVASEQFL